MVRIENHCCGCEAPGYPCLGSSCSRRNVEVYYCDRCNAELDEIYDVDGEELCEQCLKEEFLRSK